MHFCEAVEREFGAEIGENLINLANCILLKNGKNAVFALNSLKMKKKSPSPMRS